jgi:hypothetical protein
VAAVGCYTLRGRCVCVFGVKSGDLCGSEDAVAQMADWHSDAGGKWRTLMAILFIAVMIAGIAQLYLGYVGIEDWLGSGWALGALALAFFARIMLPLTIGTYLAMTNVFGYEWWVGVLVAAPGLLLIVPAMVSAVLGKVFSK